MSTHEPEVEPLLTLGPEDDGRFVSAGEFASAEFVEPWKYEREGGRLVVMSPDGQKHHDSSRPWRMKLHAHWLDHPEQVEDVVIGSWVRPDAGTDRVGDIGIYLVTEGPVAPIPDRIPDLMFEVVSPGKKSRERDYIKKRAEYHRLGVREYVIVDRKARRVTVLTHAADGYEEQVLRAPDVYRTPLLPGLEIPLADVFS
jgi:Uma2 family endonuclease